MAFHTPILLYKMEVLDKKNLRKLIRERKKQYTPEMLTAMSKNVTERILAHPRIQQAQYILLYYSLPDEVNTHHLAELLVAKGKQILLPVIVGESDLILRSYTGTQDLKADNAFHILEPMGKLFTEYTKIEVGIIPGMSFDNRGNRLGRGKGYYDRLLVQMPHLYKIGVCFEFQRVDCVPTSTYDVRMDEVL
uniref:5-formyltetrahydrofolate cyclo-ligase n=1 Tax=Prevotella sp. GTC17260 TaxID=3236796 RepID=A0AB33J972_9BACT